MRSTKYQPDLKNPRKALLLIFGLAEINFLIKLLLLGMLIVRLRFLLATTNRGIIGDYLIYKHGSVALMDTVSFCNGVSINQAWSIFVYFFVGKKQTRQIIYWVLCIQIISCPRIFFPLISGKYQF